MAVVAVTMVRDEEDVIVPVIRHLLAEGVDRVIVADNLSTDRTRALLDGLAATLPVTVLDDREPGYYQSEKMTRLARLAGEQGAEWVVPFDADEVWYSPHGRLADVLRASTADVLATTTYNHVPRLRGEPFGRLRKIKKGRVKVAFRWHPDAVIAQGNHRVHGPYGPAEPGVIEMRHFSYRSFGQLRRKLRNGQAAYAATDLPDELGWTWRQWGGLSDARLRAKWLRMCLLPGPVVYDPAPIRGHTSSPSMNDLI